MLVGLSLCSASLLFLGAIAVVVGHQVCFAALKELDHMYLVPEEACVVSYWHIQLIGAPLHTFLSHCTNTVQCLLQQVLIQNGTTICTADVALV